MSDLIARLEEGIAHRENHGRPDTCPDCLASEHYNFPAILHALKVQEAAEAWEPLYQTVTYGEPKFADHKEFEQAERALVAAVKGEQG